MKYYQYREHCDKIRIKHRPGPGDEEFAGRMGTFYEYVNNGFARIHLDGDPMDSRVLVHPESVDSNEIREVQILGRGKGPLPHVVNTADAGTFLAEAGTIFRCHPLVADLIRKNLASGLEADRASARCAIRNSAI